MDKKEIGKEAKVILVGCDTLGQIALDSIRHKFAQQGIIVVDDPAEVSKEIKTRERGIVIKSLTEFDPEEHKHKKRTTKVVWRKGKKRKI